jgi:hypothetical protein
MAKYERHREFEVHLLSYDGAQHLRLHGWLKRNDVLIKSETIHNDDDSFGRFMIFINDIMLEKLKEENLERGLFIDIDVMNGESERWGLIKNIEKEDKETERENLNIKSCILSNRFSRSVSLSSFSMFLIKPHLSLSPFITSISINNPRSRFSSFNFSNMI